MLYKKDLSENFFVLFVLKFDLNLISLIVVYTCTPLGGEGFKINLTLLFSYILGGRVALQPVVFGANNFLRRVYL